jgi:hypothetical protein
LNSKTISSNLFAKRKKQVAKSITKIIRAEIQKRGEIKLLKATLGDDIFVAYFHAHLRKEMNAELSSH